MEETAVGFKVSVPVVEGHSNRVVLCNVETEEEALQLVEAVLGYRVIGLPYTISPCSDEMLDEIGLPAGEAFIENRDSP
jgi:hypothetical protein